MSFRIRKGSWLEARKSCQIWWGSIFRTVFLRSLTVLFYLDNRLLFILDFYPNHTNFCPPTSIFFVRRTLPFRMNLEKISRPQKIWQWDFIMNPIIRNQSRNCYFSKRRKETLLLDWCSKMLQTRQIGLGSNGFFSGKSIEFMKDTRLKEEFFNFLESDFWR